LRLLASVDLVRMAKDSGFFLAPGARRYVKKRWRDDWEAFPLIPEYAQLELAVRSGRPIRPPVEGVDDDGDFFSTVVPALFELHRPDAQFLAQRTPDTVRRALDLGAGSAVWSMALAQIRPPLQVLAVDRPKVLDQVTSRYLADHGVASQYELRAGNYHQVDLESEAYDIVYLGHLLHADGWEASRRLLARTYSAVAPDGYVAVAEIVAAEPPQFSYAPSVFDLSMLMLTEHGLVFTARELTALVSEAGFRDLRWLRGPGDYPCLLAKKGG
jgi:hypothetical protein